MLNLKKYSKIVKNKDLLSFKLIKCDLKNLKVSHCKFELRGVFAYFRVFIVINNKSCTEDISNENI